MTIPEKQLIIIPLLVVCLFILARNDRSKNNSILLNAQSIRKFTYKSFIPDSDLVVSGTFKPDKKPVKPPVRIPAGSDCVVNLIQEYEVSGTLSGTFEIDYRILVHGPCGEPPGTYDEEWIAHGKFIGKINDASVSANMSYLAQVKVGGDVSGTITFGQGITGELKIKGNFRDGELSYYGWIH